MEVCSRLAGTTFGWSSVKIGTIQRRLAWSLRKDDTHTLRKYHDFFDLLTPADRKSAKMTSSFHGIIRAPRMWLVFLAFPFIALYTFYTRTAILKGGLAAYHALFLVYLVVLRSKSSNTRIIGPLFLRRLLPRLQCASQCLSLHL